jgi:glycosyltransferase involved in cell wall biosynthesis
MFANSDHNHEFSIVMPTFNSELYIEDAVYSVVNQSWKKWELIVIDNYSDDKTWEKLNLIRDPRISLHRIQNGGSIAKSRNYGIRISKHPWICFLDSDDLWYRKKLETLNYFIQDSIDFLYHDMMIKTYLNSSNNLEKFKSRTLKNPIFKDLMINGNAIATSSVCLRKANLISCQLMDEDEEFIGIEDFRTWLKVSLVTNNFTRIPKVLGILSRHSNNTSYRLRIDCAKTLSDFLPNLTLAERNRFYARLKYEDMRQFKVPLQQQWNFSEILFVLLKGSIVVKLKFIRFFLFQIIKN